MASYIPRFVQEWLSKKEVDYSDLDEDERQVFKRFATILEKRPPTIDEQLEGMAEMIDSLIGELVDIRTSDPNDTFLKARIKNYLLLKASLSRDEKMKLKVKKQLES
jgi:hypothetical protein